MLQSLLSKKIEITSYTPAWPHLCPWPPKTYLPRPASGSPQTFHLNGAGVVELRDFTVACETPLITVTAPNDPRCDWMSKAGLHSRGVVDSNGSSHFVWWREGFRRSDEAPEAGSAILPRGPCWGNGAGFLEIPCCGGNLGRPYATRRRKSLAKTCSTGHTLISGLISF